MKRHLSKGQEPPIRRLSGGHTLYRATPNRTPRPTRLSLALSVPFLGHRLATHRQCRAILVTLSVDLRHRRRVSAAGT